MSEQLENAIQKAIRTFNAEQRQTLADHLRRGLIEIENAESVIDEGDEGVEALADFLNEQLLGPLEDLTLMVEAALDDLEEGDGADDDGDETPDS